MIYLFFLLIVKVKNIWLSTILKNIYILRWNTSFRWNASAGAAVWSMQDFRVRRADSTVHVQKKVENSLRSARGVPETTTYSSIITSGRRLPHVPAEAREDQEINLLAPRAHVVRPSPPVTCGILHILVSLTHAQSPTRAVDRSEQRAEQVNERTAPEHFRRRFWNGFCFSPLSQRWRSFVNWVWSCLLSLSLSRSRAELEIKLNFFFRYSDSPVSSVDRFSCSLLMRVIINLVSFDWDW